MILAAADEGDDASPSLQFDDATTRRLEILYVSPDAIRRRSEVVRLPRHNSVMES
jgi:hypothetical protein